MEVSSNHCVICLLVVVIIILLCRSSKSEHAKMPDKKELAKCKINLSIIAEEMLTMYKLAMPQHKNLRNMTKTEFKDKMTYMVQKLAGGPDSDIIIPAISRWIAISETNPLCLTEKQLGLMRTIIVVNWLSQFNRGTNMQEYGVQYEIKPIPTQRSNIVTGSN